MKPHQRRQQQAYPYFKLATWDPRSFTWRDGRIAFESEAEAERSVFGKPGKYRLSVVDETGRTDLEPFEIEEVPA